MTGKSSGPGEVTPDHSSGAPPVKGNSRGSWSIPNRIARTRPRGTEARWSTWSPMRGSSSPHQDHADCPAPLAVREACGSARLSQISLHINGIPLAHPRCLSQIEPSKSTVSRTGRILPVFSFMIFPTRLSTLILRPHCPYISPPKDSPLWARCSSRVSRISSLLLTSTHSPGCSPSVTWSAKRPVDRTGKRERSDLPILRKAGRENIAINGRRRRRPSETEIVVA
jgi:hypothetical protein